MEHKAGYLNDPYIFAVQAGKDHYEVQIIQQAIIDFQFDYFINPGNVEAFISNLISSWNTTVWDSGFTFFNINNCFKSGKSYFEVTGFSVIISRMDLSEYEIEIGPDDVGNGILDFEAYLNQE
ncbi:hypothetical protein I5M27_02385 [Adhaeribacter sp. BT258]|uniref:Uncharacterized protein n=1 Tax=Adhaeribacter terrigena TaxID=2793070 RepID=A0ABS1BXS2_9BACT|nr:hypothetical protein [Adhaeribacter terrigena]MBK0401813.1 hypothetical protein [Adhaeribacter terrigena]